MALTCAITLLVETEGTRIGSFSDLGEIASVFDRSAQKGSNAHFSQ